MIEVIAMAIAGAAIVVQAIQWRRRQKKTAVGIKYTPPLCRASTDSTIF